MDRDGSEVPTLLDTVTDQAKKENDFPLRRSKRQRGQLEDADASSMTNDSSKYRPEDVSDNYTVDAPDGGPKMGLIETLPTGSKNPTTQRRSTRITQFYKPQQVSSAKTQAQLPPVKQKPDQPTQPTSFAFIGRICNLPKYKMVIKWEHFVSVDGNMINAKPIVALGKGNHPLSKHHQSRRKEDIKGLWKMKKALDLRKHASDILSCFGL